VEGLVVGFCPFFSGFFSYSSKILMIGLGDQILFVGSGGGDQFFGGLGGRFFFRGELVW